MLFEHINLLAFDHGHFFDAAHFRLVRRDGVTEQFQLLPGLVIGNLMALDVILNKSKNLKKVYTKNILNQPCLH
jgi:hypothetical protein